MKPVLCLLLLLTADLAKGQDTLWKGIDVSDDVGVSLPGNIDSRIRNGSTMYISHIDSSILIAQYASKVHDVRNGYQLDQVYQGFIKGATGIPELKMYRHTVVDTMLGGTRGKFIRFLDTTGTQRFAYIGQYVTLANGHFYGFYARRQRVSDVSGQATEAYFMSHIRFRKVRESGIEFDKSYAMGKAVGQLLAPLFVFLLLGGIGYLCYRLIRRLTRKRQAAIHD